MARLPRPRIQDRAALLTLCFALVNLVALGWNSARGSTGTSELAGGHPNYGSRSLLKDFTPAEKGLGFFYALGVLYCLIGLAVVCEDYFVASLEALGKRFGLSEDVSGATLMAAGSSLPEVFSSFVALANPNTDNTLGMDTIVGSSVYNTLVIVGVSAIAGGDMYLDWKPLYRDIGFYYITIIYMFFVFRTGEVTLVAGIVAVFLYCCYVGFMTQNQKIFKLMDGFAERHVPFLHNVTLERKRRQGGAGAADADGFSSTLGFAPLEEDTLPLAADTESQAANGHGNGHSPAAAFEVETPSKPAAGHGHAEGGHLHFPKDGSIGTKIAWCIKIPYLVAFQYTVPDCRVNTYGGYQFGEKWSGVLVWATFCMSIVWIGIIAWFMVAWASHVGCVAGIPDIVIGLTVLAVGTSLPDTISSVVVARQGSGDMAVANAIGSNVFNVLFGLGFPWTFFCAIRGTILVPAEGLTENVITLMIVGVFYTITFTARKFRLNARLGYVFCSIYGCYVLMIIIRYGFLMDPPPSDCV